MSIIDSIQLSGVTYQIQGSGGGGNPTVELTQAEYDALVTAGTVSADTFYVITDAQAGDLTNYYTKTETNTLLGDKADTATTYTKTETDNAITAGTSTKQDTLVSGTNIKTINNESLLGSGNIDIQGGSTYSGVSGVTINNNNEIYYDGIYKTWLTSNHSNDYAVYWFRGKNAKIWISDSAPTSSYMSFLRPQFSFGGVNTMGNSAGSVAFGQGINISGFYASSFGQYNYSKNQVELSVGQYNTSASASATFGDSGNTLFSVGNGTSNNARHNAFEIRQNGDIYLSSGGTDIKLQDHLGGGGASYTAGTGIDITNNVISVTGMVDTTTYNTYTAATDTALSNKQTTLTAGTGISIVDNVISATGGGGGGKTVTGGTNISVTTGETADTINCTLPIAINNNDGKGDINIGTENNANSSYYRIAIGRRIDMSSTQGRGSIAIGVATNNSAEFNKCYGGSNVAIGRYFQIGESNSYGATNSNCVVIGNRAISLINSGVAIGSQTTVSGTTKTNINNQLTIDTSNQVYIYNKDNTEMICLQDHLGGGGASYSAGTGIDITNNVISVSGVVMSSAITTAITSSSTDSEIPSAKAVYDIVGDIETLLSQI